MTYVLQLLRTQHPIIEEVEIHLLVNLTIRSFKRHLHQQTPVRSSIGSRLNDSIIDPEDIPASGNFLSALRFHYMT